MRRRTRGREFALQILYEVEIADASLEEVIDDFWLNTSENEDKCESEVRDYTEKLVRGVQTKKGEIDAIIEKFAENWRIDRMACVDRNILRLAAYEMLFIEEIPIKVAINEAVEIAKRYGEADSSKFVNGILDRIAKMECKK